jgi:1-deoxy-D-xylulose-5-phosphate reductoisomerase
MRTICLLGASGSIGSQTLDVILKEPEVGSLLAVSVGERIEVLEDIIVRFPIAYATVKKEENAIILSKKYPKVYFFYGDDGLIEMIKEADADVVVNALVGFVGLKPSLEVLKEGKVLCLANKESLVVGGDLIKETLKKSGGTLIPIDSEHVAIAKCLHEAGGEEVDKIVLTASGGPFFFLPKDEFDSITVERALAHPTRKMGPKISIDSSTMVNKAFEIIEAHHLFSFPKDRIAVKVDRTSRVHSYITLKNGDTLANIGPTDMRIPISYALHLGVPKDGCFLDVKRNVVEEYGLLDMDYDKFPLIKMADKVLSSSTDSGAYFNAADEVADKAFLNREIRYVDIKTVIDKIMSIARFADCRDYAHLLKVDRSARALALSEVEKIKKEKR